MPGILIYFLFSEKSLLANDGHGEVKYWELQYGRLLSIYANFIDLAECCMGTFGRLYLTLPSRSCVPAENKNIELMGCRFCYFRNKFVSFYNFL